MRQHEIFRSVLAAGPRLICVAAKVLRGNSLEELDDSLGYLNEYSTSNSNEQKVTSYQVHATMGSVPETPSPCPELWITGLGSQYPPYLLPPEKFRALASKFHDLEKPV